MSVFFFSYEKGQKYMECLLNKQIIEAARMSHISPSSPFSIYPCPVLFPLYCRCEAAFLQTACPDIQQQLFVDLSFFHPARLRPRTLSPVQAPPGPAAWLRRRGCPLGPKLGLSLQQRAGLRSGSAGLRQEQPPPVHK